MNLQVGSIFGSIKCPFACLWGALRALGVIRGILLVTLWLHCVTLWLHFGYIVLHFGYILVTVWWRCGDVGGNQGGGWGGPEVGPMRL